MNYDSQNSWFKNPVGAVTKGQEITFFVKSNEKQAVLVIKQDNQPYEYIVMTKTKKDGEDGFTITYTPKVDTIYFYYFKITTYNNQENFICKPNGNNFQITVHEDYQVANWYKESIIYQIFPDRYCNLQKNPIAYKPNSFIYAMWEDLPMNIINEKQELVRQDFYGGTLKGIISKLPYMKDLGISCIYFNPIFESNSCHKYNTKDYHKIDEMLGDEETFIELIDKAKENGINIVLDGVFNHTGDDSEYFQEAQKSKDSKYYPWYYFIDYPNKYESWWGFTTLPKVNCMNPTYMDFVMGDENSVIKHWMDLGVKGWRLDVVDELTPEFVEQFKSQSKKFDKDSVLIGEVWEDASNKIAYSRRKNYFNGKQLDSVMGYPFRTNLMGFLKWEISGNQAAYNFAELKENYPKEAFYANMNLISSHDIPRAYNYLGKDELSYQMAVFTQMTFAGIPHIYYGDEVHLEGEMSPDNRRSFPWGKENKDTLKFFKDLIKLRNNNKNLFVHGEIYFIPMGDDVFAYKREDIKNKEKRAICILLRKDRQLYLNTNEEELTEHFTGKTYKAENNKINIFLQRGYYLFTTTKLDHELNIENKIPETQEDLEQEIPDKEIETEPEL